MIKKLFICFMCKKSSFCSFLLNVFVLLIQFLVSVRQEDRTCWGTSFMLWDNKEKTHICTHAQYLSKCTQLHSGTHAFTNIYFAFYSHFFCPARRFFHQGNIYLRCYLSKGCWRVSRHVVVSPVIKLHVGVFAVMTRTEQRVAASSHKSEADIRSLLQCSTKPFTLRNLRGKFWAIKR